MYESNQKHLFIYLLTHHQTKAMSFRVLVYAFILFFIGDRFVLSAKNKNDLAEAMDRNKDGSVDKNELTDYLLQLINKNNNLWSKGMFRHADKNKDGFVTWVEFKNNEFPDIDEIDEDDSLEDSIGEFLLKVSFKYGFSSISEGFKVLNYSEVSNNRGPLITTV